jgi:hypothetical protein
MIFQRDPNPRPSRDTMFRWTKSVLDQLMAGLEGSSRRRVQMLEAQAALREHEQMLLKLKETPELSAGDCEEQLAGEDQIENREGTRSKELEHT